MEGAWVGEERGGEGERVAGGRGRSGEGGREGGQP